jgi:hypothetical protein
LVWQYSFELASVAKEAGCRSICGHATLIIKAIFCLLISGLLSGCLEVKQSISFDSDGSGQIAVKLIVEKEWAPIVVPQLKKSMQQDAPKGMQWSDEKQDEAGNSVLQFTVPFKDVSELSDKSTQYVFASEGGGFFNNTYRFEIRHLTTQNFDMPIPFEFLVKMPGIIDETNGIKISPNEAKWTQTGTRKGTVMSARSSATSWLGIVVLGVVAIFSLLGGWFFLSKKTASAHKVAEDGCVPVQNSMSSVFCTECGQRNSESDRFCTGCGEKLSDN